MVLIGISGKPTSITWYEIWEGVVAINTVCVRKNKKGGKAYRLGKFFVFTRSSAIRLSDNATGLRKNIYIELVDEFPDALPLIDDPMQTNSSSRYDWFEVPASFSSLNVDSANLEPSLPLQPLTASDAVQDSISKSTNLSFSDSSMTDQS